jgi:hypothetical protein
MLAKESIIMAIQNTIWIRTAKTAGTSVENALLDELVHCGDIPHFELCPPGGFVFPPNKIICLACDDPAEIAKFSRVHAEIWEQSYKFGIVRNPYDRFISGWKYLHATKYRQLIEVLLNLPASGAEYVHLTLRQADFLTMDGNLLNIHLLRFEQLQSDFDNLCNKLGLSTRELKVLNKTTQKDECYFNYYTDETKRLVAEIYKADFNLFGYEI